MPVTPTYLTYVIDQLAPLGHVTSARMFGGIGLYSNATIFALISDDTLFFKVDDASRREYEQQNMPALRPVASKPQLVSKNYYQVPATVIDDTEALCTWAKQAIAAAQAKPTTTARKKKAATPRAAKTKTRSTRAHKNR
jgi:DNA transformation protein